MGSSNAAQIQTPHNSAMSHPFFFYENSAPGKLPIFNSVTYTEPKTLKEMGQSVKAGNLCYRLKDEGKKPNKYVMMQPKDAKRADLGKPYILREGLKTFQQLNGHATALGQRPDHSLRALNRGTPLLNVKFPAGQKAGVKPSPHQAPKPKAGTAKAAPSPAKPAAKPAHPPAVPFKAAAVPHAPAKKFAVQPKPHAPAKAVKPSAPAKPVSPVAEVPKKAEPPPPPPQTPPKTDDAAAPTPVEKIATLGPAGLLPVTSQEIKEKVSAPSLRETYKRIEKDLPPSIRYFAMFLGWGDIPEKSKTPEKPAPGLS